MDRNEMIVDSMNELRESMRGMTGDLSLAKTDAGRNAISAAIKEARRMYSVLATEAKTANVHPDTYQLVGAYYTHQELHDAFGLLHLGDNWKAPIDAYVPTEFASAVVEAIGYFCGGGAKTSSGFIPGFTLVQAPGYYALIGA